MKQRTTETNREPFGGDKKVGKNLFFNFEQWLVKRYVDRIPSWLETHHLTLMTLLWSGLVILFSYLAKDNVQWMWLVSAAIIFQYITDLFDGAVGRHRNTGLIRWGYYMDHFLDYIFLCSILIGYSFLAPDYFQEMFFFILAICVAFMINSYLAFAATNKFQISYLGVGPTEMRLVFLVINFLQIIFGRIFMAQFLPHVLIAITLGLVIVIYRTQKEIWEMDVANKKNS